MHLKKYEWVGSPDIGDCSLWVRSATLEFDDGLWQCQVTASDFTTQDALASEPARLVVRGKRILGYILTTRSIVVNYLTRETRARSDGSSVSQRGSRRFGSRYSRRTRSFKMDTGLISLFTLPVLSHCSAVR